MRWILMVGLAVFMAVVGAAMPAQAESVETNEISVDFSRLLNTVRSKLGVGVNEPSAPSASVVPPQPPEDPLIVTEEATPAVPEDAAKLPAGLVEEIQLLLTDLGYDTGSVDGIVGPTTVSALEEFQRTQGLPVDGELSLELVTQLKAVLAAAEAREQQQDEIVVASGTTGAETGKTPLLDNDEVAEIRAVDVGGFDLFGVSLGDSLGTVRRMRPFDQKGELDKSGPLISAVFGGSDGEILRKLEVRFGAENQAIWVRLEQGNFPVDAINGIVGNLCERYGATDGCAASQVAFTCYSAACKRGLHAHEMRWQSGTGKALEATFFTGGSETVMQVILTLSDRTALEMIEQLAIEQPPRPSADAFKL